ncbi:MAG: hypothetical protein ABSH09_18325 [Bryobacteraceae bacterium]|jgi:hypothetical protein
MKIAGFLLLLVGWIIVLTAVALLKPASAQGGFVLAGIAIEIWGLVLVSRAHRIVRSGT